MKTRLEKIDVCDQCYSASVTDTNCVCAYDNYKTITLEFEICVCCGHIINDGYPADTPFNEKQLKNNIKY